MQGSRAVRVARITPDQSEGVRALQVTGEQAAYVGDPAFNLDDALRDPRSEAMAMFCNDTIVGFYRLDFSPNAITGRPFAAGSVGLRAFLVDRRQQGDGIGTQAAIALCADLALRHPLRRVVLLAVHGRNHAATVTYRKAGFIATGRWLGGGRAGPQQLMLRELVPVALSARVGESGHG